MLPNSQYVVAYHRFDGLSEDIRGVEWSVLAGAAALGVGRVGGSLIPDTVALVGAPSLSYGTLHGSEALTVSLWAQGMSETDASIFFGFLDADRAPSNGIRIVAEPTEDGVFFPMWVELLNSRTAYRFPVPLPDMDSESNPNPGVPHMLLVQVRRNPAGGWRMEFAPDGGEMSDGGAVDAPRVFGPDIDLPSQTPDDESTFGVLTSGVALDEFAFWSDAPHMRRAHSSRMYSLWSEFRSSMDLYTDRFGEDRHDPLRQHRGRLGTPCRVNHPPSIDGPESMLVEFGTLAKQNEIEFFATDPDGGEVQWSVALDGSSGTVEIHRHPSRKDAILVRYAPNSADSLAAGELNTCVRDIAPDGYTPGSLTTVVLTCIIDITETSTYVVEDTYPAGWIISNISPGGVDNGTSVRWFFLDRLDRVVSYDATPPALEAGEKVFVGTIGSDGPAGFQSSPVGGESLSSLLSVSLNTCVRDLTPNAYAPSVPTAVTLSCTIDTGSTSTYVVEDTYPAGWIISNISPGGVDNGTSVRWFFLDRLDRVVSYDAIPPALATGLKVFAGTIDSDGPGGFQSGTTGGETETLDTVSAGTTTAPATTVPSVTLAPETTAPATTIPSVTLAPTTTVPPTATAPGATTAPGIPTDDDFVIRAESRCGLFVEAQVRVMIV